MHAAAFVQACLESCIRTTKSATLFQATPELHCFEPHVSELTLYLEAQGSYNPVLLVVIVTAELEVSSEWLIVMKIVMRMF